jgi:hypothetical protein
MREAASSCIYSLTVLCWWLVAGLSCDVNAAGNTTDYTVNITRNNTTNDAEANTATNTKSNSENNAENNAQQQWELVKSDQQHDITVYYRRLPTGNIEFKGVTKTESSLSGIVAVFLDFESMPQWLYRTQKVILLKQVSDKELYIYTIHTMPFPFRKRDSATFIQLTQTPSTKLVTIKVSNAPDYIELNDDYVRVPVAVSQWQLLPLDNGRVQITFSGHGEPGGSISPDTYHFSLFQWLVRQFLWKVPYKSLLGLKEYASQEKYQKHKFYFIQELNDG